MVPLYLWSFCIYPLSETVVPLYLWSSAFVVILYLSSLCNCGILYLWSSCIYPPSATLVFLYLWSSIFEVLLYSWSSCICGPPHLRSSCIPGPPVPSGPPVFSPGGGSGQAALSCATMRPLLCDPSVWQLSSDCDHHHVRTQHWLCCRNVSARVLIYLFNEVFQSRIPVIKY